jgi:hypothetical protein
MHPSRGSCIVSGELACVQGELFVVLSFGLLVCAPCLSMFCLGCVEPLPLPKRSKTCLLQLILLIAFSLDLDRLLDVLLVVSFLFLFSYDYQSVCVVKHSSRGRLRAMCGSRTGGCSLLSVMSD